MVKREIYGVDAKTILLELRKVVACLPVPPWAADDICQQALLTLVRCERDARPVDDPVQFAKQCARNFAIDWLRRRASREKTRKAVEMLWELVPGPSRPDEQVMTEQLLSKLLAKTDDNRVQHVCAMLFLSGWTEAEIVRELRLRRGKVRWQIDRIKEKFATVRGENQ